MTARAGAVLAATLVLAAALAGCGVPEDDAPRALNPTAVPFQPKVRSPSPSPTAPGNVDVPVYLVRDGQLVEERRAMKPPITPRSVLDQLLGPLTQEELNSGLSTAIPDTVEVARLEVENGIAVVTLSGTEDSQVRSDQPTAFGQIVTTLDQLPGIDGVRFRREGVGDLDVPRGDTSLARGEPLTTSDYRVLLAAPTFEPSPPASPSPAESASPSPR